ncbi:MAG: CoA-binding protein [Candidatus Nanohalarchaeota archaeon]|nr:MAG: CoA-binding protein [Candidatus Nanohaloarchaeota archaeon]
MKELFNPKSIAVIGASANPQKFGYVILKNIIDFDFKGKIYPISPRYKDIFGIKCFPSVLDVKDKIDTAVVVTPFDISNKVIAGCVKKKIPYAIIITAGYKEIGGDGIKREEELKKILKNSKTRVIGPNCIGIFDNYGKIDTLFLPKYKITKPNAGSISIISQSGAVGLSLIDVAACRKINIARFASFGNNIDIGAVDLLKYMADDPKTKVILMYIEGIDKGRELYEVVKSTTKKKPVIIYKAGKSDKGKNAAASHTGNLAGSYKIFHSAMKQAGAIEAMSLDQMFDFAMILEQYGHLKKKINNLAIITDGGGFGVMTTDSISKKGIELPDFEKKTIEKIRTVMPPYATINNPMDLIGDADTNRYAVSIYSIIEDKNIDAIIIILLLQISSLSPDIVDIIANEKRKTKKPIIVIAMGDKYAKVLIDTLKEEGVPVFPSPSRAANALSCLNH